MIWAILTGLLWIVVWTGLGAQDDPLLRKSWLGELREEEARDFHRVQSRFFSKPHFLVKKDRWNREYKLKHNGDVIYVLGDSYRKKFPDASNPHLAWGEAQTLYDFRFFKESLHLLKGLSLCLRENRKGPEVSNLEVQSVRLQEEILRQFNHKPMELSILTDPYGCYQEKGLKIESEVFRYEMVVPEDWNFIHSNEPDGVYREGDGFSYRLHFWEKGLPVEKEKRFEDEWIEKLKLAEAGVLRIPPERIVLLLGSVSQENKIFHKENFFGFWDSLRGLNRTTMRQKRFSRKEKIPGYESSFFEESVMGQRKKIIQKEFYYWNRTRGLFLLLSYPESQTEALEPVWASLIESLNVRK